MLSERDGLRIGLSFRVDDLFFRALGGYGTASGDDATAYVGERMLADIDRFGNRPREGERGELGDGDVDFEATNRKVGPFDGDLESERRSCLKAEAGST